jgi:magnesium transporter
MLKRFGETHQSAAPASLSVCHSPCCWIDLLAPTKQEEAEIEAALGIDVPTHEDIRSIEPSSRLFRDKDAVFAAAQIVVLKGGTLLTIRYEDSRVFDLFAAECERSPDAVRTGAQALIGLLEAIVDRTAELLEEAGDAVDDVPDRFHATSDQAIKRRDVAEFKAALAEIQGLHRRTAKVRESLVSLGRMIGFLMAQPELKLPELRSRAKSVARDILSLSDHASFVAQNVQFVLDAALGMINIEQNAIVKFFSIVAVVLLPPTLIAGIYGMNFQLMPELSWPWGYPAALLTMLASAILPYLWCRRRGWL